MWALVVMVLFYGVTLGVVSGALALAAWWLRFPRRGFGWAMVSVLLITCVGLLTQGVAWWWASAELFWAALSLVLVLLMWGWIIMRIHRVTAGRACAGLCAVVVGQVVMAAVVVFVMIPFVAGGYRCPTFAMAPTILCEHREGVCPNCGGVMVIDASDQLRGRRPLPGDEDPDRFGICAKCFRTAMVPATQASKGLWGVDHFVVVRFLTPRRWDVIEFKFKKDFYVKRLVGMPGETISIDSDGVLSVNGAKAGSPPDRPGMTFPWPESIPGLAVMVKPGQEVRLGPEEYFVLGDNSQRSTDSRFTGPVKRQDVEGVVSLIYWPPSRFQLIR